jgi:hypothetical protein
MFPTAFVVGVWWLLVLPFLQGWLRTGRWLPDYRLLFEDCWRDAIMLAEGLAFTAIFWLILQLWQESCSTSSNGSPVWRPCCSRRSPWRSCPPYRS